MYYEVKMKIFQLKEVWLNPQIHNTKSFTPPPNPTSPPPTPPPNSTPPEDFVYGVLR